MPSGESFLSPLHLHKVESRTFFLVWPSPNINSAMMLNELNWNLFPKNKVRAIQVVDTNGILRHSASGNGMPKSNRPNGIWVVTPHAQKHSFGYRCVGTCMQAWPDPTWTGIQLRNGRHNYSVQALIKKKPTGVMNANESSMPNPESLGDGSAGMHGYL